MIIFLFILFFLVSFAALFPVKNKKTNQLISFFLIVTLIAAAAFRKGWADYGNYVRYYEDVISSWSIINVEISFQLLSHFVKSIFNDVLGVFIIYAILGVGLKVWAISKLSHLFYLSILIYLGEFYILHELIQIRAGVAAGFLLLSIRPIYDRNLYKFLFFFTLAFLFHYSSLVIFPLWFVNRKFSKFILASIVPLGYIIYATGINLITFIIPIPAIQYKLEVYQSLMEAGINAEINVFNLVFLTKVLIFYVLLWKKDVIDYNNSYSNILMNIFALSLFCFPAFAIMPVIGFRISDLLGVVEIVLFPLLFYILKPRIISTSLIITIGVVLLIIEIFYNKLIY